MSTPPEVPGKRESLDTRIEFEERGRIDRAAKVRASSPAERPTPSL